MQIRLTARSIWDSPIDSAEFLNLPGVSDDGNFKANKRTRHSRFNDIFFKISKLFLFRSVEMSQVQRKQGMGGLFRPVSWNKGRRFTSPGPEIQVANKNVAIQNYEVRNKI